ncbi:hypothetical protein [Corynebacterium halotolerans]|uniref:hypothetical protein n=1 Tax=Corynebacterium halotolerans TaxID=225326 RepID=UPI003CF72532
MSVEEADHQIRRLTEGRLLCAGCLTERPVWQFRRISLQGPAVPRHWSRECFACESLEARGLREGTEETAPVDSWSELIGATPPKSGSLRGFPSAVSRARRAARRAGVPVHRITAQEIREHWGNRPEVIGVDLVDPARGFCLDNLEPITAEQLGPEEYECQTPQLAGVT